MRPIVRGPLLRSRPPPGPCRPISKLAEPHSTGQYSVPSADVASTTADVAIKEAPASDLCQAPAQPDALTPNRGQKAHERDQDRHRDRPRGRPAADRRD